MKQLISISSLVTDRMTTDDHENEVETCVQRETTKEKRESHCSLSSHDGEFLSGDNFPIFNKHRTSISTASLSLEDSDYTESMSTLNVSICSSSNSWAGSFEPEKRSCFSSFGSLGLPSSYPCHSKDVSGTSTSCTFPEELDEFDEMQLYHKTETQRPSVNPLLTIEPVAAEQLKVRTAAKPRRSRRNQVVISSTEQFESMVSEANHRRRRRNQVLTSSEFEEAVFQELTSGPLSIAGRVAL